MEAKAAAETQCFFFILEAGRSLPLLKKKEKLSVKYILYTAMYIVYSDIYCIQRYILYTAIYLLWY
jgi:hypothetical protein